jgi:hypothetical protein
VELEALSVWYKDTQRLLLLLRNLMIPGKTEWMAAHCEDKSKDNFIQAWHWLRSKDEWGEFYNITHSKQKAHLSTKTVPGISVNHMSFYI